MFGGCLSLMLGMSVYAQTALRIQGAGGAFSVPVTSLKEARLQTVVRQQYDFSCGSAAVATLLTFHYEQPVGETEAFEFMYRTGDQQKIRQEGFSMLDMKRFLDNKGLQTDGFPARSELQTARRHFNDKRDWSAWPQAPIGQSLDRTGLGIFSLTLPGRNELGR
ncbi:MAG: hypothetical protein HZB57_05230 [Gammaproteobacteria bacterium]|nr:hypothetical protein [Gammaproteobacteria bacterium]